jgi:2-keto-4-pentenoate hydratase/2-oxohepta-3-ene-1,7-dioic acid hydratase in catechol pathway
MKWCRYQTGQNAPRFGIVEGDTVLDVNGSPFETYEKSGTRHMLSAVRLAVPCMPYNFYAVGANFRKHLEWASQRFKKPFGVPPQCDVGYRSPSALIATDEPIIIPADSEGPVQYEGELVAVVGRTAKKISKEDALRCILGYTLGNDLSERTWQFGDRTMWRGKNADTFKPMGPLIETDLDPNVQDIIVRINGKTVSEYNMSGAIYDLATAISRTSQYVTLHPGDVIWMGCDNACEPDIVAGDVIEIENKAIGVLRNPVTRASA